MINVVMTGRTARIIKPLYMDENIKQEKITFTVACDRNYYVTKADGSKEMPTDFVYCEATGAIAKTISENFDLKKEDGKLASRKATFIGTMESYEGARNLDSMNLSLDTVVTLDDNCQYEISVPVKGVNITQTNWKFVVRAIEFLDANPVKKTATATVVGNAPVAATIVKKVASTTVIQPSVVTTASTTASNPMDGAMNPPVPTSEEAFD